MESLEALESCLAAAVGPDRELDAAVARAIGWKQCEVAGQMVWFAPMGHTNVFGLPYYTSSIGAALTLVPDGWEWQVSNRAPKPHAGRAYLNNSTLIYSGVGGNTRNPKHKSAEVTHFTPALAICLAAVRARASQEQGA